MFFSVSRINVTESLFESKRKFWRDVGYTCVLCCWVGFYETAQRAERTQRIGLMSDAFVSFGSIINRNTFWFTPAVGAQNHIYKYAPFGLQANCQFWSVDLIQPDFITLHFQFHIDPKTPTRYATLPSAHGTL